MNEEPDRIIGAELTTEEGELLDLLCSGADASSAIARAQRATAQWGGIEHEGCECFLISISGDVASRIDHEGGPFSMAEVSDGTETLGLLELWVVDGLLHSVNYMPFGGDHVALPTRAGFEISLIDRE